MAQSYKYYLEQPERIREIDYEDLLLNLEEKPFHSEVKVLALMKQKFTFGQIDEELIHNLIATTSDKMVLNEYLEVIEQFPSKSEYLKHQSVTYDNVDIADDDTEDSTTPPGKDQNMTVVEELPAESEEEIKKEVIQPTDDEGSNQQENQALPPGDEDIDEQKTKEPKKKKQKKETRFEKVARKFGTQPTDSSEKSKVSADKKDQGQAEEERDPEEMSFGSWLHQLSDNPRSAREIKRKKKKIKKEKLWKGKPNKTEKLAEESVQENEEVISETLANLYVQQGLIPQAKDMYEKLSLKFPEKSIYFAAKIKELKNLNS